MAEISYIKSTFTYNLSELFTQVRLRSANISSHLRNQAGETQELNLAITDSERDLWNIDVRYPCDNVYNALFSAGKVTEGDYSFSNTEVSYTLYLHADWDKNLTRPLNNHIEKAIVYGSLASWYKGSMQPDAFAMCQSEYEQAIKDAKFLINKRKYWSDRKHITF